MGCLHRCVSSAKKRNFIAQDLKIEKSRFQRVIDICRVVSDFVHPINKLCFERRAQIEQIFSKLRKFRFRVIARMFDDALAHFKREIQPRKVEVALFEMLDDAKRVQIVVETPAMDAHQFVQLALARMPERRMANVVNQGQRFSKFRI